MAKRRLISPCDAVVILLLAAASALLLLLPKGEADGVRIELNGEVYAEIMFSEIENGKPRIVTVESEYGLTTVEIGNGYAAIRSSSCKTHSCVSAGEISKSGQSVICLPCRVSVSIIGDALHDGMTG